MARRTDRAAEVAASAASDAARVLQARQQEAKADATAPEPSPEPRERAEVRVVSPRNEPRRRAMEEIEARDLRSKGMDVPPPEPEKPKAQEPSPESTPEASVAAPKLADATQAQPDAASAPELVRTVRVKVDGEEFDAPADEVEEAGGIKAYQRDKAAENRLKKANDTLAEARRVQASIAEFARMTQQQQAPEKPSETDAQFIASKMDIMRFGTPEEGAAAHMEILQRMQQKVDPNTIAEQVQNKINHDLAVREFDKEFADVSANPMLLKLVVALRNERLPQLRGSAVDWGNFYRTIGNEVRSVSGRQSQLATAPVAATSGTPSQSPSDKEARKASIVTLPTAAARAELPRESKPETREEILNEMKRKRGLPIG